MTTREQAALICAICASTRLVTAWDLDFAFTVDYKIIQEEMGFSKDARYLAEDAWRKVIHRAPHEWTREVDAEAEALLRCGWSP